MKIVLDTNCIIQSIPRQSRYRKVWDSLVRGEHVLCVSTEILEEYVEILQRLTDYDTAELIVKTIINSPFVELVTPYYHFEMIKTDPDDNKFVNLVLLQPEPDMLSPTTTTMTCCGRHHSLTSMSSRWMTSLH